MAGLSAPIDTTTPLVILGLIVAAFMLVVALDGWRQKRARLRREQVLDSVYTARARRRRGE
jgi:hypothetical protein